MIRKRTIARRSQRRPHILWWEAIGAWLHIWTPPKDVEVPAVPWRWVAAAASGLAALVVVALFTLVPAIDASKRHGRAEEARRAAESRRAQVAHLRRDQRATIVPLRRGRRGRLGRQVAAAVDAGARVRIRSGELKGGPILTTECDRPEPASGGRQLYYCLAVQRRFEAIRSGIPFFALVSRDRRSVAWCKINPRGGEGVSTIQVPLPRPCSR